MIAALIGAGGQILFWIVRAFVPALWEIKEKNNEYAKTFDGGCIPGVVK